MKRTNPHILVCASGTKNGGGSGFETMVRASLTRPPILDAWICAVITNHFDGGVWHKAKALGIRSEYWAGPYTDKGYQNFVKYFSADYVMLGFRTRTHRVPTPLAGHGQEARGRLPLPAATSLESVD